MSLPAIKLRAIEREDLPQLRDWRNGLLEQGTVRQWRYLNMVDQERWFAKISTLDSHDIMLIVSAKPARAIGVVGLTHTNWQKRYAEISIYIGDPEHRGKGYGEAALRALLDYGFGKVGLHRIFGEIYAHNEANIALFKKLGFQYEGCLRHRQFHAGKWIDSLIYSLLEGEWPVSS